MRDVRVSLIAMANPELLRACLASLPGACDGLDWDLHVVDNRALAACVDEVRRALPGAVVHSNDERLGFGANHNQVLLPAVAQDDARYLLVLNDDVELEPGSVSALVDAADADARLGAAGPSLVGADGTPQFSLQAFPTWRGEVSGALRPRSVEGNTGDGWLNGSCLLLRAAALREVGGFDEEFFLFYEDVDLGLRLRRAGWRSAIVPAAGAVHRGHQTVTLPEWGAASARQVQRSRFVYLRKHHGPLAAHVAAHSTRLAYLLRAAKALLERERPHASFLADLARYDPRRAPAPR